MTNAGGFDPGGSGELRTQREPVGDDWIVWEAEESSVSLD